MHLQQQADNSYMTPTATYDMMRHIYADVAARNAMGEMAGKYRAAAWSGVHPCIQGIKTHLQLKFSAAGYFRVAFVDVDWARGRGGGVMQQVANKGEVA
jgi:hypothetical protein